MSAQLSSVPLRRSRRHVNLYSDRFAPRRVPFSARFMLIYTLTLALALAGMAGYLRTTLRDDQAMLVAAQARLARVQAEQSLLAAQIGPAKVAAMRGELAELQGRIAQRHLLLALTDQAFRNRGPEPAEMLSALGKAAVPGVWLTEMRLDPASGLVVLHGNALRARLIPDYLHALQGQTALSGARDFEEIRATLAAGIHGAAPDRLQFIISNGGSGPVTESPAAIGSRT